MNEWQYLRKYEQLVTEGLAKPLTCPDCNSKIVTMVDNEGTLVLYCAFEDRTFVPGRFFWDDLMAVVKEYFL